MQNDMEYIGSCFTKAIQEVIGTMAGFDVGIYAGEGGLCADCEQITGAMMLLGTKHAMVYLTMERAAASIIVAYMTGILPEELSDDELYDGVAELVNMMAGRVKMDLMGTPYHFELSPPFTITGRDLRFIHKLRVLTLHRQFHAGDMLLSLDISYC